MDLSDGPLSSRVFGRGYVLERELGRGGMATVYLARDERHERRVAVKVLHAELAAVVGAERFLAEIRVTAQLQHPHILGLIDSGVFEDDAESFRGRPYYVMPYIVGESLRARLEREGPLPLVDALRIVREVAGALDHAHRHGIVHRDVKPENVLLGEDGDALVADFGIALAVRTAGGVRLTESGLSLGTPQYMSPEQAMGERQITARTDVYALGAVLYEMLAGEPPFTGASAQAIVARVLTEAPRALVTQRPTVPLSVDVAVRRALEKLPGDRFASAAEFVDALTAPTGSSDLVVAPTRSPQAARRHGAWTVVSIAGVLVAGAALGWAARGGTARRAATTDHAAVNGPVRFAVDIDSGSLGIYEAPAISPDGRTIVYSVEGPDGNSLFARQIDGLTSRPLAGTDDAQDPFFSPDGAWVAFFTHGTIQKTRLSGGSPVLVTLTPAALGSGGGWWSPDDTIRFGVIPGGALYRVSASGGVAARIPVADTTRHLLYPQLLPGGRAMLVSTISDDYATGRIAVLDLSTGRLRDLASGTGARYAQGHLLYAAAGGHLYSQPFDSNEFTPRGEAEEIASGLETPGIAFAPFAVSSFGALVYSATRGDFLLSVVDRGGRPIGALSARTPWSPRFAPDGKRIAFGGHAPNRDISDVWIGDPVSGTLQRLTASENGGNDPQWSPDGKRIAFHTIAPGGNDIAVQGLDETTSHPVLRRSGTQWTSDWLRDGSALLFTDVTWAGRMSIWILPLEGGAARPYVDTPAAAFGARASSDGHWVAYTSNETGRKEVYVQSYPTTGRKTTVSTGGGENPVWRGDGRELYYWQASKLIAASLVAATSGDPLRVRARTVLFSAPYLPNLHANYDVSGDGTRFVIVMRNQHAARLIVALGLLDAERTSQHAVP